MALCRLSVNKEAALF